MRVCGIIAEYNPFHRGHKYLIDAAADVGITHTVVVMSGNFVQRGDAAICSKWSRAEMALKNGVDLVIELSVPYATATAQRFAFGAVGTLNALGCVDSIVFGSECGDVDLLQKTAESLADQEVNSKLREKLANGITFAAARQSALEECGINSAPLGNPNDSLAIEYVSAIKTLDADISPIAIKRIAVAHDAGSNGIYASASHIRELICSGKIDEADKYIPTEAADILHREIRSGRCPATLSRLDMAILAGLRTMSKEQLLQLPDISEGLENRLYDAIRESCSVDEIIKLVKTKRYTHARIRRIILSALLGIDRGLYSMNPRYIRVLGMNEKGKEILSKANNTLPIITRAKDVSSLPDAAQKMFYAESAADDLYSLMTDRPQKCGSNLTNGVIIL